MAEEPEEDLDAIGGWVAPEPRGAAGYLEDQEKEREARYQAKVRENEEWYAAELAKLEGRDPEEAVRQLGIERGWIKEETASVAEERPKRKSPVANRPVSWSNPRHKKQCAVTPYIDPESKSAIRNPQSEIARPFPIGWVRCKRAAAILQLSPWTLNRLGQKGTLTRRKSETGRRVWLYDTVELERVGEERGDRQCRIAVPGKRLDWWGSRRIKAELNEFDGWLTAQEAAHRLGVSRRRIGFMCDKGMMPCWQEEPGKPGSRLYVPAFHIRRISERPEWRRRHRQWAESRNKSSAWREREEWDIEPVDPRGPSRATDKSHGEYVTTKQAALMLGVGPTSVHNLRLRGRLVGVHLHAKRKGTAKGPWWFFKRTDVDALLADGNYRRNSARGKKIQALAK